jgi:hypothetical protein
MTEEDFRRRVLALDGAVEGAHMGHPDFRAHGRVFASIRSERVPEPTRAASRTFGAVMLTPEQQQIFSSSPAFTPESGAWGRAGWTRVRFEQADEEKLGEAVTLAWQNAEAASAGRPAPRRSGHHHERTPPLERRSGPRLRRKRTCIDE